MLNFCAICPHPLIIIPEIGHSDSALVRKTIQAMEKLSEDFKKSQCQTIIIISPHGPMRYDKFIANYEENFKEELSDFDANLPEKTLQNDLELTKKIFKRSKQKGLPIEIIRENKLDYGTLVPLYYLTNGFQQENYKIIPLAFTALDWKTHFVFGKILGEVAEVEEKNIAIIASGDLSHRLSESAPAGFSPYGIKFDKTLINLLEKGETNKILNLNPEFSQEAGECGLRSIIIALGAISDFKHEFQQLSYESPFGVGYLVGKWKIS